MAIDLIIFDCDGVLVDSEALACRVDLEELMADGITTFTQEDIIRRFSGVPQMEMVRQVEAETGLKVRPDFAHRVQSRVEELMRTSVKPHACCRYAQGPIDAVLELRRRHALSAETVAHIDVGLVSAAFPIVCEPATAKRRPRSVVDAQFSLPFSVAITLVAGAASPDEYTPEHFDDPLHRRFREHLVTGGEANDEELVVLRAELGARAERDALDERTGRELALRLHERKLRRDLQGADLVRATELQARLAKIRTALHELA